MSAKKKTVSINYPSFPLVTLRLEMASVLLRMLLGGILRGHSIRGEGVVAAEHNSSCPLRSTSLMDGFNPNTRKKDP